MPTLISLPAIADEWSETLILGSMPGERSLAAGEYYAHPQNTFWRILGLLYQFDARAPYPSRVAALQQQQVAVWDVLHSCRRSGSLDTAILLSSEVPQDFPRFFAEHPRIRRVFFNGSKAEASFRRHVRDPLPTLAFTKLPSTSPAHASCSFEDKLSAWRQLLAT